MYLNRELTADDYNYLLAMHNAGFTTVFTSLHIPEYNLTAVLPRLKILTKWCQNLEINIFADVSKDGLKDLGIDISDGEQVKSLNLTGLRIDDGVDNSIIAKLSKAMPISLNASTISEDDVASLRVHGADFEHLQAWHNYYPRPETGLDSEWFKKKNAWLHKMQLKTMAFISGDNKKRGPIFAGLPTLEKQRNENPLSAMLELKSLGSDYIFIGDSSLKTDTIDSFTNYMKKNALTLHVSDEVPELFEYEWHNRSDVARDTVRLVEGRQRQLFDTVPQPTILPRPKGTVTCDNAEYLRYQGELQITKRDLPADDRVNVLTRILPSDLSLLNLIDSNRKIIFKCGFRK